MTDIRRSTQSPAVPHATEASAAGGDGPVAAPAEDAVVRRTKDGWRVDGAELSDLTSAMVLADLLSAELAAAVGEAGEAEPDQARTKPLPGTGKADHATGAAPASASHTAAGETSRLRATIRQLEHALTARIRVEQAIGVLAERHRIQPRQAFEQLRTAARNRGRRVIDIASDVVASATNPLLQLPDELSRPRSARKSRRPRGVLGSE